MATLNSTGSGFASSLVSSGAVDQTSPWSFSAEDGNKLLGPKGDDWNMYGKVHLGTNPDAKEQTKDRYAYPFAKVKGSRVTLYRSAIAAIRQRASQQGDTAIFDAAGRIMSALDKKKGAGARAANAVMPMPRMGETHDDFMSRCMGDDTMMNDFPDMQQRAAVCERQASQRGKAMSQQDVDLTRPLDLVASVTIDLEAANAALAEGDTVASPILPRFEMVANTGAAMRLQGWRYPVVIDLAGLSIPSQQRPIRMNHDANQGVGHTNAIAITNGQLTAGGLISRDTPAAKDVLNSGKNGFPWQASVGAAVDQYELIKDGQTTTVNGQTFEGPVYVVTKSTLGEISFVDLGADGNTKARVAAMGKETFDDDQVIDADGGDDYGAGAFIAATKAEKQRKLALKACMEAGIELNGDTYIEVIESLHRKALDNGLDARWLDTEILRACRARVPAPRRPIDCPTPKVLEAALLIHCGVKDEKLAKDHDYGPDVVTQAWPMRHRGLRGTIAAALEASGVRVPHGSRELFDAIIENRFMNRQSNRQIQAEGFSTVNLPGILGAVANKILLDAFTTIETTYDTLAEQSDFSNFHTYTMFRLDHLGDFQVVPPDGEIKHGRLSQSSYTNKLDTYGQMLTLTRQDIINDNMNAFRSLTVTLAKKARAAVEKAFINAVMESVDSFYTVGQGNRLTGALGITELAAAETAMASMVDANGDPIFATPRYLLVPPGLRSLADAFFLSELLQGATSSTRGQPATNIFRGRFQVFASPYLAAAGLDGSSATTWYLLADPNVLPAFQVAYLDGRRAPTIETQDAEFDTLGLSMRCFFDFGVGQLDYRGAVKSTAS